MSELISREELWKELHNAGGCDGKKGSYDDGWDSAITEAIRLLEQQPAVKLPPTEKAVYCSECLQHGRCAIEGIYCIAKIEESRRFCPAGEKVEGCD